jgi:hypothetical protein
MTARTNIPRDGLDAAFLAEYRRLSPEHQRWALRFLRRMVDDDMTAKAAFIGIQVEDGQSFDEAQAEYVRRIAIAGDWRNSLD